MGWGTSSCNLGNPFPYIYYIQSEYYKAMKLRKQLIYIIGSTSQKKIWSILIERERLSLHVSLIMKLLFFLKEIGIQIK